MSIDTFFMAVYSTINYSFLDTTADLSSITALLSLQTGVPANGYHFTNLAELIDFISGANYLFELGYAHINGVLVYAIKIGNMIYSVEPRIFHSFIFSIFNI
jgi:hypothetical protein